MLWAQEVVVVLIERSSVGVSVTDLQRRHAALVRTGARKVDRIEQSLREAQRRRSRGALLRTGSVIQLRRHELRNEVVRRVAGQLLPAIHVALAEQIPCLIACLLYTSDAADER